MSANEHVLTDDMLQAFAERCGRYDRENRFFKEDFDDLRRAGYLTMAVPTELGGKGMNLAQVAREQRRLAYHAPATALGINMHVYWVGLVADLWHRGDRSAEWLLREAMAGEVFNAGHAERGNDIPVLLSTSTAERVDGGFCISGHKMFCSLAPVWTRYGLHATWADADGGPKIVHAFLPRSHSGHRIVETWDTLGMRATKSDDVVLDGAFVPDKYVARIVPAGQVDPLVLGMFAWALTGFANVYCGMARRSIRSNRISIIWPRTGRPAWITVQTGRPRSSPLSTTQWKLAGASLTAPWRCPAAPACSGPTNWSGYSGTRAVAASTQPAPS